MLARIYDDADAVVMTPAYAAPLGLTPKSDALLTDSVENDETQVGCAARRFFMSARVLFAIFKRYLRILEFTCEF